MENRTIPNLAYERYMDAAVELFMEHYAQTVCVDPESAISEQDTSRLSEKCKSLVKATHRRKKLAGAAKGALRVLKSVAVFAVAVLSLSSFLFITVEAVRKPILNFYIKQNDGNMQISGVPFEYDPNNPRFSASNVDFNKENPLGAILANEDFYLHSVEEYAEGELMAIYYNSDHKVISLSISEATDEIHINTENLLVEHVEVSGRDAILTMDEHSRNISLTWYHSESDMFVSLHTDYYTGYDLIDIAEILNDMLAS